MKGILLRTDGSSEVIQRPTHQRTLQWLYEQIGCHTVDVVTLGEAISLWLDDEGMLVSDARPNWQAVSIARGFGQLAQLLYGNAVLLGGADDEGNTLGLPDNLADDIMARLEAS